MSKTAAIFVLGMHRSGTSALAGALAASGVWLGDDLLEPAPGINDKGFWEHRELVEINEALLEKAGLHWYSPLAARKFAAFMEAASEDLENLKARALAFARKLIEGERGHGTACVAIKDPRLCLTANFWQPVFEKAGADVVGLELLRHPAEVGRSLERRDGIVASHSNVLWLDHVLASSEFCHQLRRCFAGSYDALMQSPLGFTKRALEALELGLEPDGAQVETWIQEDLRHHGGDARQAEGLLADEVALLYEDFIHQRPVDSAAAKALTERVSVVFDDLEKLFGNYNATVIQLQDVSKQLDLLGKEHARAMKVVEQRDKQLETANSERDRLGALHQEALDTIAGKDETLEALREEHRQLADAHQQLEYSHRDVEAQQSHLKAQLQELGDNHHHALTVINERDHQLEALNARISAFEASLVGRLYRVWSAFRVHTGKRQEVQQEESGTSAWAGKTRFPRTGERPPVDVIIPVYGGFEETCAAVKTAASSIDNAWARLVVINDCSPEPAITRWLRDNQAALGYELLENEKNLGFVGTVNRGMKLRPEADVLLLNSDVEVANDWLARLQDCAYSREKVASVTATANNATICSFPVFCEDNELPAGFDVQSLDQVFGRSVPANMAVEIPSGIGCCMYMRRDCMDAIGLFDEEVFGRGYGEENDWSQRAIKGGWANLHALNVFVYHKGGVSFAEHANPLQEQNLKALLQRYPSYNADVQAFIQQDPAKSWRMAMYIAMLGQIKHPKVLLLAHGMGGGVYTHIRELIREHPGLHFLLIEPAEEGVRFHLAPERIPMYLDFQMDEEYPKLIDLLRAAGVGHVHVHHTMGLPTRLWGVARDLSVTLDFTLHDYAIVNGNPSLLDEHGSFVGDAENRDTLCSVRFPLPEGVTPEQWRNNQLYLLEQARYLICPSNDMYRRVSSVREFSHLDNWVVTHHMDAKGLSAHTKISRPTDVTRVLVLGALSPEKGADILENVARATSSLPIEFHLLGYAYKALDKSVVVHGPYQEEEASSLIRKIDPHVVWFPVQCAETYSYTLSLALQIGLPVVASRIGAFSERLAGRKATVLFDDYQSATSWTKFWYQVAKNFDLIAASSIPTDCWAPSDEGFYEHRYLDGLSVPRPAPLPDIGLLNRCLAAAHQADALSGNRERFFQILVKILHTRIGSSLASLIPISTQRRVKRRLTRKPMH